MDYIEKMATVDENSFKNPLDKQYIGDIKDLANTVIEIEDGLISKNSEKDIDNMLEQGDNLIKIIDQSTNLVNVNHPVKYMFQQLKNTWNETAKEIKDAKLEKKNKHETLSEKFANAWAAISIQNEYYKNISKAVTYQNLMSDVNLYTNYLDKYSDFTKKAKKCLSETIAKIDICTDKILDAITFGAYSKTAQWVEKKFYANYKSFDQSIEKSEMKSLADVIVHKFITNRFNTFERKYGHASSIEDMNKNIDNYYKNITDNAFFWGNKTQIIKNAPQYNGSVADVTFTDYKKSPVENAISFKEDIKKYFTNEVSKVCGTLDAVDNYIDNKYDTTVEKIKQFGQKNKEKFNSMLKNIENTFKNAKDAISWQYANIKMSKIKYYIASFRLRTLPLSLSGIFLGTLLAASEGYFNWAPFLLAVVTTLCLQILSNLANELGDLQKGTDNEERLGPIRSIQSGALSLKEFKRTILLFVLLSVLSGTALVSTAFESLLSTDGLIMLMLGAASIVAAIKYTVGKNAYGYHGLGDVFVFLFFGLLSVCGAYFLMTHRLSISIFLPATAVGLLSTGVLNLNNMRDIENDRLCGKRTLPVILGISKAKVYHFCLIIGAFVAMSSYMGLCGFRPFHFIFWFTLPLFLIHLKKVVQAEGRGLDPQLKVLSLSTLLFTLLAGWGAFHF